MLRNLVLAGLTALLAISFASTASAARGGATRTTEASRNHSSEPEAERPVRPVARKKTVPVKVRSRAIAKRRAVIRRAKAAAIRTSLLRPSWTVADLNPMPALLDLDDTTRNMRQATALLFRMMTR